MRDFYLSGLPTEVSGEIEIPEIGELLLMPWYQYAPAEYVYDNGGKFYQKLLESMPIHGNRKNILVTARVQLLKPESSSIVYSTKWHVDGEPNPFYSSDRMHLFISECTARTEFNTEPFIAKISDGDGITQLNRKIEELKLTGKPIEPNRVYTFDNTHAHRAISPKTKEFRFMFRVLETNLFEPPQNGAFMVNESFIYHLDENGNEVESISIAKHKNGIMIHM